MSQYENDAYETNDLDAYRFSTSNGQISAVYEWDDGRWQADRIDANDSWLLSGAQVIHTETERSIAEVSVFEDTNADGIYYKVSESYRNITSTGSSIDSIDSNTTQLLGEVGTTGVDVWLGTSADDSYDGSDGVDDIYGGEGSDHLYGGNDNDHLSGGIGSDRLDGSAGDDHLNGGDGFDRAIFSVNYGDIESYGFSADGKTIMFKTSEGTDTLEAIEQIEFLDGVHDVSSLISGVQAIPLFMNYENGVSGYLLAQRFSGDSSLNLDYQLINENFGAVLQGSSSNDFIKLAGLGNKACDGLDGDDVLDGGTGSAFLTGGGIGSADTFFLDGRADADAWSTLTDYQIGTDALTIWGWQSGVSTVRAISEFDGAEGYKGLTLSFENLINDSADGLATDGQKLVTFSGLAVEDFGANSIDHLNAEIQSGLFEYASSGVVADTLGDHGYWQLS